MLNFPVMQKLVNGQKLDGKASEYYALLVERNQEMVYVDLIWKLEKRFGFRELPETAQVQFNNARQTPDELLEDWADRVLSLATRAFRDLPETHMYQQAVVRLCQGAADNEAGVMPLIADLKTQRRL